MTAQTFASFAAVFLDVTQRSPHLLSSAKKTGAKETTQACVVTTTSNGSFCPSRKIRFEKVQCNLDISLSNKTDMWTRYLSMSKRTW